MNIAILYHIFSISLPDFSQNLRNESMQRRFLSSSSGIIEKWIQRIKEPNLEPINVAGLLDSFSMIIKINALVTHLNNTLSYAENNNVRKTFVGHNSALFYLIIYHVHFVHRRAWSTCARKKKCD